MKFSTKRRDSFSVEVTPLIDIIFQLVLFFMVSTTFDDSPKIDIDLPESSTNKLLHENQDIEIWLSKDGEYWIDKRPLALDSILKQLEKSIAENPQLVVVVKADKEVDHGQVVNVLDLAQKAGVKQLSIGARSESSE